MRLVQIAVPAGKYDAVLETLDDLDVDYLVSEDASGGRFVALVFVPLPTDAVEATIDALRDIGLEDQAYTIVLDAKTIVSSEFERTQDEYDERNPAEQIAHEEIHTQAREYIPTASTYMLLSVVSAVVATAGLLLDSAAVVVGSMVIAPLIGPAMATSVGSVLYDQELFREGVKYQILGFIVAIVGAILFSLLARFLFLVPPTVEITAIEQVSGRLSPDLLSLAVALGSGVAGARSLSSDISTALVGVMIAAALIPPTAAVGIGVAWWHPDIVLRAGLLVLVNVLSINLAALATLWHAGYRPHSDWQEIGARVATGKRIAALLVGLLILAGILGTFTYSAYQTGVSTQNIEQDVESVLEQPEYANASLVDVEVEQQRSMVSSRPVRVDVTVARPPNEYYPLLPSQISDRIENRSGRDVDVQVQYVAVVGESNGRVGGEIPGNGEQGSGTGDESGNETADNETADGPENGTAENGGAVALAPPAPAQPEGTYLSAAYETLPDGRG